MVELQIKPAGIINRKKCLFCVFVKIKAFSDSEIALEVCVFHCSYSNFFLLSLFFPSIIFSVHHLTYKSPFSLIFFSYLNLTLNTLSSLAGVKRPKKWSYIYATWESPQVLFFIVVQLWRDFYRFLS